jgi:hypothetical protein
MRVHPRMPTAQGQLPLCPKGVPDPRVAARHPRSPRDAANSAVLQCTPSTSAVYLSDRPGVPIARSMARAKT